jgi:aminopeptidase N
MTNLAAAKLDDATISKIESIAKNDDHAIAKAAAIDALAKLKKDTYKDFFAKATRDSSYSVAGAALEALGQIDGQQAFTIAKQLMKDENKGRLLIAITNVTIKYGDESSYDFISGKFEEMPLTLNKVTMAGTYSEFLAKVTNAANFKKGC